MGFNDVSVIRASIFLGLAAVVLCFHMFAMRLSMNNIEDFAQEAIEKREQLIEKSKESTQTKSGEKV